MPTASIDDPESGARVVFEGAVRRLNEGKAVRYLEYEAFAELAVPLGEAILEESKKLFEIRGAECVHRVGSLQICDLAIRVIVTAAHRKAAFEACAWIVDRIKSQVPIWKKEFYEDGSIVWLDPTAAH